MVIPAFERCIRHFRSLPCRPPSNTVTARKDEKTTSRDKKRERSRSSRRRRDDGRKPNSKPEEKKKSFKTKRTSRDERRRRHGRAPEYPLFHSRLRLTSVDARERGERSHSTGAGCFVVVGGGGQRRRHLLVERSLRRFARRGWEPSRGGDEVSVDRPRVGEEEHPEEYARGGRELGRWRFRARLVDRVGFGSASDAALGRRGVAGARARSRTAGELDEDVYELLEALHLGVGGSEGGESAHGALEGVGGVRRGGRVIGGGARAGARRRRAWTVGERLHAREVGVREEDASLGVSLAPLWSGEVGIGGSGGTRGRARRDRGCPRRSRRRRRRTMRGFAWRATRATARVRRAAEDAERARTCCFPILDAIADVPGSDTPRARPVAAPRARVLTRRSTPAAPDQSAPQSAPEARRGILLRGEACHFLVPSTTRGAPLLSRAYTRRDHIIESSSPRILSRTPPVACLTAPPLRSRCFSPARTPPPPFSETSRVLRPRRLPRSPRSRSTSP